MILGLLLKEPDYCTYKVGRMTCVPRQARKSRIPFTRWCPFFSQILYLSILQWQVLGGLKDHESLILGNSVHSSQPGVPNSRAIQLLYGKAAFGKGVC
jgi:hypothetical protein